MKRAVIAMVLGSSFSLTGCAWVDAKLGPDRLIKVEEVGRSMQCTSRSEQASMEMLDSAAEAVIWQRRHQLDLTGLQQLPPGRYVVIEMGLRENGAQSFVVSPQAEVERQVVRLHATVMNGSAEETAAVGVVSPCVLLRLPEGRWKAAVLFDQNGEQRADTRPL